MEGVGAVPEAVATPAVTAVRAVGVTPCAVACPCWAVALAEGPAPWAVAVPPVADWVVELDGAVPAATASPEGGGADTAGVGETPCAVTTPGVGVVPTAPSVGEMPSVVATPGVADWVVREEGVVPWAVAVP